MQNMRRRHIAGYIARAIASLLLLTICFTARVANAQSPAPTAQEQAKSAAPAQAATPAPPQEQAKPAAAPAPAKNDYSDPDFWLCRPGLKQENDACAVD